MKYIGLFIPLLLCGITGCGTMEQMRHKINQSTESIHYNRMAVERSTEVIRENGRLIESSTKTLEENKKALKSM